MSKRIIDDLQIIYDGLKNQSGGGVTSIVVDGKTYTQNHGVITLPNHPKVDFNSEGNLVITINGVTKVFTPVSESVTEPEVFYSITNVLTKCTNSNTNAVLKKDSEYVATLTANSGYKIKSVKVTMGGTIVMNDATNGDVVDINIPKVTGDMVITAVAEPVTYTITNTLTQCSTNNNAVKANHNSTYEATITADDEYKMNSLTITMGGTNITSSVVTPIIEAVPTYPVTNTLTHCTTNNTAATVEKDSVYEATITADDEYKMDSIAVTMGGTNIDSSYITPVIEDSPRI